MNTNTNIIRVICHVPGTLRVNQGLNQKKKIFQVFFMVDRFNTGNSGGAKSNRTVQ